MKKFLFRAGTVILCVAVAAVCVLSIGRVFADKTELTVKIDPTVKYQTINGWGASACWWAQKTDGVAGDETIRLLYSKEGLGLNIYRFNVGAGEKDNPDTKIENDWRKAESFYVLNEETGEYEYDFTKDAVSVAAMKKALSYGCVDTVVLFANSPHYSMTESGLASGGEETHQNNLPRENFEAYADYFLTITEHFINDGVPVKYISPFNEPQWSWGGDEVWQEGCHYEPEEFVELTKVFLDKIKERNLDVKLSVPENGCIRDGFKNYAKKYLTALDEAGVIDDIEYSYHSYKGDRQMLTKKLFGKSMRENYPSLEYSMSEWCELPCQNDTGSITSALIASRVITQDIGLSCAGSWCAWNGAAQEWIQESGEDYSDGLISVSGDFDSIEIAMRYYALAHFSKFVPQGSVLIETKKSPSDIALRRSNSKLYFGSAVNACSFLTPQGETVCVLTNEGPERKISLEAQGNKMNVVTTTQSKQLENKYSGEIKNDIILPENSITTLIFSE